MTPTLEHVDIEPEIDLTWQSRAACRTEDWALFFPPTGADAKRQTEQAQAICQRCDVRPNCLLYALRTGQEHGVWGGVSEQELRDIRKRAKRRRSKASKKSKGAEPTETPRPQQARTVSPAI